MADLHPAGYRAPKQDRSLRTLNRILEAAEQVKASMIVMGSRGRTGLPHLLLGSKAERIAQMAPMPVTIVKAVKGEE